MSEKLLEIKNLKVQYKSGDVPVCAVNGIDLSLNKGETLGLVGETGAGKTTTALAILRLLPERTGRIPEGSITFDGQNLLEMSEEEMRTLIRGEKISMIFQDPMTSLNPVMTVGEQIAEAIEYHNSTRDDEQQIPVDERVNEVLEMVGIPASRKDEYPHQFSGGMKQRVVIAMALSCEPELLIADEPTTALDVTIQAQVLAMMSELRDKLGTAMILITHDLGIVASICDKVAIMYAGKIIEEEELREQIKGAGIGTSATRAEIIKKLEKIQYIAINNKTQIITPTQKGEIIYDVIKSSMPDMLNPKLTASWEKGLEMVAKNEIQPDEFMQKLENYIRSKFDRLVVKY